jgi:tetratricopeptide (TPR) repeat protein
MALRHLPLALAVAAGILNAQVTVHEDKLTLSVWNEGPPDPNPQFAAFYNDIFPNYPYTQRAVVNKTSQPGQFREIVLENEYLSCRILPDLGGHLHGCTDKVAGREIFYANPAVRHGGDGQRGNFIPMGIESSFPIAHTRVSASPVDFAYSNRDGVGRVIVEDTDRVSGMQWRVEFILRQGVAVLEQRVTLHNGSDARRGYQWWTNAGIELDDPRLRFVYPVKWMLPHGDTGMTSWPLNPAGVDLSDVANHKEKVGLFAHGSFEPWMAVYKPKFRAGVAHYADAEVVHGKKVWVWGADDKFVMENLTENFNSYVEMQAGLFETQPDFAFLIPEGTKTFSHYWIPFHNLGGISRATPDAVLNLARSGSAVTIEIEATHAIKDARIRVSASAGTSVVLDAKVSLDPRSVWVKTLDAAPAHLAVDISSPAGATILHHVEGEYDGLPFVRNSANPEPVSPPGNLMTEAAILERGVFNEQRDQLAWAWGEYRTGLEKFPGNRQFADGAARVALALYRYDDVIKILSPIVTTLLPGPADLYYYGVARAKTGGVEQAKAALVKAAADPAWGPAARLQLAMLAAREHNLNAAIQVIETVTPTAWTGAVQIALLRRDGKVDDAKQRAQFWSERDPADNMIRVERTWLDGSDDPALWEHLAGDPQRLLDVVDRYLDIGAADDALKLLDRPYPAVPITQAEPGTAPPRDNPLIAYYRGYCRTLLGQSGETDFKTAASLPTRYIFPHRASAYAVLKAAVGANNSDAVAHDLLGDLYFDSLDADRAIAEWRRAISLKSDLPALARNLGRALLEVKGDPSAARPLLLQAARMNPGDADVIAALKRVDSAPPRPERPSSPPAAATAEPRRTAPALQPASADIATLALLRSVTQADEAARMFTAEAFPKEKQPDAVRRAYIEVQLQRVLAMARDHKCSDAVPALDTLGEEDENLPFTLYGFGAFMKAPHFEYYRGVIEAACGDEKAAKKTWGKLPKPSEAIASAEDVFPYLALLRTGNPEAKQKVAAAIESLKKKTLTGEPNRDLLLVEGSLLLASGHKDEGTALLERTASATNPFVQYLSLAALQ